MGQLVGYDAYVCFSADGSGQVDITSQMVNENDEVEDTSTQTFTVEDNGYYKLTISGDCYPPVGSGENFELQVTSPSATSSKTITLNDLHDGYPPNITSMSLEDFN